MRALAAAALAALSLTALAPTARADDPQPDPLEDPLAEDTTVSAARAAGNLFFMAIAHSEDSYLKAAMRAPVAYDRLRFEDPKCAKQFAKKGKVTKAKLGRFATCVLALVRNQPAGELVLSVSRLTTGGEIVVSAANPEITFELTLVEAKDGTLKVTGLRSPPAAIGAVGPPEAGDLVEYTRDLPGKGALVATIATSQGDLHCTLYEAKTPRAVANFVGLATGKKAWVDPATGKTVTGKPFYDGLTFHRVIKDFMIQGGDPLGVGTGGPGYKFADEIVADLGNRPGTLVMANSGKDTNGSQFFVNQVDNKYLDGRFTVFGACAELDVVTAIALVPTDANNRPKSPVTITRVTIARARH